MKRIPNFGGLKYTARDLVDLGRCLDKYGKNYNICYGTDEVDHYFYPFVIRKFFLCSKLRVYVLDRFVKNIHRNSKGDWPN